ncbi:hypothetical protein DI396_05465 [Litorivita pollutaquae]|uniref:Uncharacterized protein n=1 Tax=Litorivita pollutaquae TaxID=2200892 RepID=A0A2V4NPQ9_9RHOB|nr:hypothetical protein [Litorivita pollutaquae]PYC48427.1 hypothetical protein DI396_05465 [Litorivita pollutaquae]
MSSILSLKRSDARNWIAAFCLLCCLGGAIAQGIFGYGGAAVAVMPLFGVYLALAFRNIAPVGFVLLFFSLVVAVLALANGIEASIFVEAAGRVVFLSALLTAVAFLRIAATNDRVVEVAGEFLTLQPPTRRYASLGAGGHLFGVLLNLGGLGVMLEVIMKGLRAHRDEMDDFVYAARKRRMVSACMRGFSSIAFWTPFGISLNLMVLTIPGLEWAILAPYGIALAGVLFLLGWLFDTVEWWRPPSARGRAPALTGDLPGWSRWAALIVAGHVIVLGSAVVSLDRATPFSFQTVLISVVPIYAVLWAALRGGGIGGVTAMSRRFVAQSSGYATEMSVIASAGFIGLVALEVVPVEWVADHLGWIAARPVLTVILLVFTVFLTGLLGVHPMISVVLLAEVVNRVGVEGLSPLALGLSLAGGWSSIICMGPAITAVVYASGIVGESPVTIGLRWNGLFGIASILLVTSILATGVAMGLI